MTKAEIEKRIEEQMNWKKIKNDYPAAWEAFVGTYHYGNIDERGDLYYFIEGMYEREYYNTRDLYGFFDERGLIVAVNGSFGSNGLPVFTNHIVQRGAGSAVANFKTFDSRTEAEAAAFERAFSILEGLLK